MKRYKIMAIIGGPLSIIYFCLVFFPKYNSLPKISFPPEVSIAQSELGQLAYFYFKLENLGGNLLQISNIRSNCSCLGFEVFENNDWFRLSDIQIPINSAKDIRVKVSVRGVPPGRSSLNKVFFQTNDPANRECVIDFVIRQVRGGIIPIPENVILKTNALGLAATELVEIWDDSDTEREIEDVSVAIESQLKIEILPKVNWPKTTVNSRLGNRICCFKIEYCPNSFESKTELIKVRIKNDNTHLESIRAFCSVEPILTSTPTIIRLPRKSEKGLVFSSQIIISAESKKVEFLGFSYLPKGISFKPWDKKQDIINQNLDMDPTVFSPDGVSRTDFVELELRVDGVLHRHRIPIEFHKDETGNEK